MMGNDRDYLLRRERECRTAAERARDPAIRRAHLEFAAHYAREAELEGMPPPLSMQPAPYRPVQAIRGG